jgi:hypothetical protein
MTRNRICVEEGYDLTARSGYGLNSQDYVVLYGPLTKPLAWPDDCYTYRYFFYMSGTLEEGYEGFHATPVNRTRFNRGSVDLFLSCSVGQLWTILSLEITCGDWSVDCLPIALRLSVSTSPCCQITIPRVPHRVSFKRVAFCDTLCSSKLWRYKVQWPWHLCLC